MSQSTPGTEKRFLREVRLEGRRRPKALAFTALGRQRVFQAFDIADDTFVFEKDIWRVPHDHAPMLVVAKSVFAPGAPGHILTLTTGNHSVAALPLLTGKFWNLGGLPPEKCGEALKRSVVCANMVDGRIEISQREVPMPAIVDADVWLRGYGWSLADVVLADREDATLEYYRRQGQEWRIKPLAWTRREMEAALRAERTRIHSALRYYHNVKGVHFLTYPEFLRLRGLIAEDFAAFRECIAEIAGVHEGAAHSFLRDPKHYGHHEVEFFGVRPALAQETLVPAIEEIEAESRAGSLSPAMAAVLMDDAARIFRGALAKPALADEDSDEFVETLYKHLTGEVYLSAPGEVIPAFDDRLTALPGATYRHGRPDFHPGVDARTLATLDYLASILSHDESIEYVNVYELRTDETQPLGRGRAREIVYKTNRSPLSKRLVEKRLSHSGAGYGCYVLARVQAFQALGVAYGDHHLLSRHDGRMGDVHFYVRQRYPGEAFGTLPRQRFLRSGEAAGGAEDPEIVLAVAGLMGGAAAQNLAVKRYVAQTGSICFGEGKEIIEFGYDVSQGREMPVRARICSVRGALGWPDTAWTEENLQACFEVYMTSFARAMVNFLAKHPSVTLLQIADRFWDGFSRTTRELHWKYTCLREQFDLFDPDVRSVYKFKAKWRFALWALVQQFRRLPKLREMFTLRLRALLAADQAQKAAARAPAAAPAAAGATGTPAADADAKPTAATPDTATPRPQ